MALRTVLIAFVGMLAASCGTAPMASGPVETGQTAPDHATVRVDQRADGAVADHTQRKRGRGRRRESVAGLHGAVLDASKLSASQARRASGCAQRWCARVGPSPTLMPMPPKR